MRSAWVAAAILVAASVARADVYCDSPIKGLEADEAHETWRRALLERRFGELDAYYGDVLARLDSGKITDNEAALYFWLVFRDSKPEREALYDQWVKQYPHSRAARVAQGYYYASRGWSARGQETHVTLLGAWSMRGEFGKAMRAFDLAASMARKPTVEWAQQINLLKAGAPADGKDPASLYAAMLKLHPESVEVRIEYLGAMAPRWGGRFEDMQRVFDDAVGLPADERRMLESIFMFNAGTEYSLRGDSAKAAEFFERGMSACPGYASNSQAAGRLYNRTKDYRRAIVAWTRYLERFPRRSDAHVSRAHAYAETGQWREAYADYEVAAALGDGGGTEGLAWMYHSGNGVPQDYRKAMELYMAADAKGIKGARDKADKIRAYLEKR